MPFNHNIHHRRSIRLKGYDYSQAGLYFITICCNRKGNPLWLPLWLPFGKIENKEMILNDAGKMIETEWVALITRFQNIELHEYIVMPNHFHGILQIVGGTVGATTRVAPTKTIGDMMDAFKSITTVEYIRGVKTLGWQRFDGKLWQRNYYENIIRDEQAYQNISNYVINNPAKWNEDKFFTS